MVDLDYFYGRPIEIKEIGTLHPLTVYEYSKNRECTSCLQITRTLLLQQVEEKEQRKQIEQYYKHFDVVVKSAKETKNDLIKLLKLSLRKNNILFRNVKDLKYCERDNFLIHFIDKYKYNSLKEQEKCQLFTKFKEQNKGFEFISIDKCKRIIHRDNYDHLRNILIKMNAISLPKQAKTKELQKWFDKATKQKNRGNKTDLEDILSTIGTEINKLPDELLDMTMYQAYCYLARINAKYEFNMNVRFMCAGAKDIKLNHITKHIDILEEEKISTDFNVFKGEMGGLLEG